MNGLSSLLGKLSLEDVEKLKLLMSLMPASHADNESKEAVTLRVFMEEYKLLIQQNRSKNYFNSVVISFDHLIKYFKPQRAINSISLRDAESFITQLQQNIKKGYPVYYRTLKAAFNKAKDWGYVKENYFTRIKLPRRQKLAPAFINNDQLTTINSKIDNEIVRDVVVIGFYTGMRLNEIVNLKWKNVNLTTRTITVGDEEFVTKGKNQRFIPISDEALQIFLKIQKSIFTNKKIYEYVFCKNNGDKFTGDYFSKRFKRACNAAGMDKGIHFHSLRHSFASNLAQQSVSLYVIKELLGHSSISTTEIYSHLNLDTLREAIMVLD
ncbi:MAG: tyrosine-type recombinase/integrase [Ignavibacteriaceae bacterium]